MTGHLGGSRRGCGDGSSASLRFACISLAILVASALSASRMLLGAQGVSPPAVASATTSSGSGPDPARPVVPARSRVSAPPGVLPMSLAGAVRTALGKSEAVLIAQAGIVRARGQVRQGLAAFYPQLSASAGYTRTVFTQYAALAKTPVVDTSQHSLCTPFLNSSSTPAERQAAFDAALSCPGGINFGSVGFGALNQYTAGLSFSQTLFNGQVLAQSEALSSPPRAAKIELRAQQAQVTFDVTQAYYDAALADRLTVIADSTLVESDRTLQQTQVAHRVGTQSDYDLLQAQVTRNNQVPVVIQRRSDRDIAYFRLKQLLKLPLDTPLELTTDVEDSTAAPDGVHLVSLPTSIGADGVMEAPDTVSLSVDTAADRRSTVLEQVESVKEQKALHRVAQAERLPALNLTSAYQKIVYPNNFPNFSSDFLTNWNVAIGLSVPILNGGRIKGDEEVAEANLAEARARLQQTRELAALDSRTAIADYRQSAAAWAASVGTVGQAVKAYQIAELRYREGISTQTELTDQRIAEQQALANRAQAARNLQVARIRLALIADLPLSNNGSAGASAAQSSSQGSQTPTPQPNTTQNPTPSAIGGLTLPGLTGTTLIPNAPPANQFGQTRTLTP
jgi:outer membrane protein TolC